MLMALEEYERSVAKVAEADREKNKLGMLWTLCIAVSLLLLCS